jgi:hypothetical protein
MLQRAIFKGSVNIFVIEGKKSFSFIANAMVQRKKVNYLYRWCEEVDLFA